MGIGDVMKYICKASETILEAMEKINNNSKGMLFVVDESDSLVGCLTDGNIRRWLLKNGKFDANTSEAMNPRPIYVNKRDRINAFRIMTEHSIKALAVVDDSLHIIDVVFYDNIKLYRNNRDALSKTPVIVMAGGKGTRLYPYTKILPKPLIPIGDIPILERILDQYAEFGVTEFYLTINYRKEMIKSYFTELTKDYEIHFIEEDYPLGTAGGIRLIRKKFAEPVIVTNCDILIDADYADAMDYHNQMKHDITIVASRKKTTIPYGVLKTDKEDKVVSMDEKPELINYVNTGMYIVDPEFIDWIPKGKEYHMTDLVEKMIKSGKCVGMYIVSENAFLDMGEFAEMKRMEERINAGFLHD